MAKVNTGDYGRARPKVEPEDLEGDVAVLTVATAETGMELDDPEQESGKRMGALLTFKETGEKVIWLNKSMLVAIVDRYGDDDEEWIGKPVPVEKAQGTFRGNKYKKVQVVYPVEEWDQYLKRPRGKGRRGR